ncbi:hypothetical protein LP419_30745 [Massilia sp. H-1]|nr:hypothetical protein LP419_30745 [Massilia sp. H-1]
MPTPCTRAGSNCRSSWASHTGRSAVFKELIERQLASYRSLFGAAPLAKRYLIIINQNQSGDGGAFSASFSQFLRGHGDRATRPIWGRVVAHELLHFWNGVSLV